MPRLNTTDSGDSAWRTTNGHTGPPSLRPAQEARAIAPTSQERTERPRAHAAEGLGDGPAAAPMDRQPTATIAW